MKTLVKRACLTMVALLVCSSVWASDVAGKWKADFETPDGRKLSNTFNFIVDGEKLTGTVVSSVSGQEVTIAFTVTIGEGDQLFEMQMVAKREN